MKYDINTAYSYISEKAKIIGETNEVIETLKKDLDSKERRVEIATIQYSIGKCLVGLHEIVSYLDDIKTDRTLDDYLIHQIITARILNIYLVSMYAVNDDIPYMTSKIIGEDIFDRLNPKVYGEMLLKDYMTITYSSVCELVKFKPYIAESDADIFSVIGPIIKLTPNGGVKYFKFIYNGVQGSAYISKNDKGINSVALVYNNTCAFFDTDKSNSVLEFSYDTMCYGKLMSHIIDKVSNE